jgi:anti-anti-sigma factor
MVSFAGPTLGASMDEQNSRITVDRSTRGVVRDPERPAPSGLAVRSERRADVFILWLGGALDRVTSALVERELQAPAGHASRLVVDLTGLELIDSHGLEALVRAHRRACESDQRLSFRYGPHVGQRPCELTRDAQLRSRAASRRANASTDEDLFALAMACADVDHQRPRDRPRDTLDGYPGQAAGASDPPTLPGVARAAPRTRFLLPAPRRSADAVGGNPAR